jgi:hypothetical protein
MESQPIEITQLFFSQALRLLEKKELWSKLDIAIDRSVFIKKLEEIREIRNNVMHFDPDGITESELDALRKFVTFFAKTPADSKIKPQLCSSSVSQ